jgi:hypothetical protein
MKHSCTGRQTTPYLLLTSVSVYARPHISLGHACRDNWLTHHISDVYTFQISQGEIAAASNALRSNTASGASLSTCSSTGAVNKKSVVRDHHQGVVEWYMVDSALGGDASPGIDAVVNNVFHDLFPTIYIKQ